MNRYIKINIDRYQRLFEGKKQALQILEKTFVKKIAKGILNQLEELDPTSPKNKYIEVFTKIFLRGFSNSENIDSTLHYIKHEFKANDIYEKLESIEKRQLKIPDLNKLNVTDHFVDAVDKLYSKKTKSMAKKGIKGLQQDKDYIEIPDVAKNFEVYIPLNHATSRILASHRIGQDVGRWCTSENNNGHWVRYIHADKGVLAYVINYNPSAKGKLWSKQAIYFYQDKSSVDIFDKEDDSIDDLYLGTKERKATNFLNAKITNFVYKNWAKIRKGLKVEYKELQDKSKEILKKDTEEMIAEFKKILGIDFKVIYLGETPTDLMGYISTGKIGTIAIKLLTYIDTSGGITELSIEIEDKTNTTHRSATTNMDEDFEVGYYIDRILHRFANNVLKNSSSPDLTRLHNFEQYVRAFELDNWLLIYTNKAEALKKFKKYVNGKENEEIEMLKDKLNNKGLGEHFKDVLIMLKKLKKSPSEIQAVLKEKQGMFKDLGRIFLKNYIKNPIIFGTPEEIQKFWNRLISKSIDYDTDQFELDVPISEIYKYLDVPQIKEVLIGQGETRALQRFFKKDGKTLKKETNMYELQSILEGSGWDLTELYDPKKLKPYIMKTETPKMVGYLVYTGGFYKTPSGLQYFWYKDYLNYD